MMDEYLTMDDDLPEEEDLLPAYLRQMDPPAGHVYGTLSYNRRSKCWVVKGDPSVTEMCKRLFPGSMGSKRGEARFTAHRRMVACMISKDLAGGNAAVDEHFALVNERLDVRSKSVQF